MIQLSRPFLRGAMQALRFHRRLSALFETGEQQPFTTLASAADGLDLFDVGERHELWDTLWGLEFLSLWPAPAAARMRRNWARPNARGGATRRANGCKPS